MERLYFRIKIKANPETVYNTLIDKEHFQEWTSVFSPTSYFDGTWEKDSKMHFLNADDDGNFSGMVSVIKEHIPSEFISIEHCGFMKDGEEILEGEEVQAIKGALENYRFIQEGEFTDLQVESDAFPDFKDFFMETWPKALIALKRICEQKIEDDLQAFFKQVNQHIAKGQLDEIVALNPPKPTYFNWVEDIFYPLHVKEQGDKEALIWLYKEAKKVFSFKLVYERCNQLVNLLRKNNASNGDVIYTMLPLIPENWFTFLAGIKGGFVIMPTATNLVTQDLLYRFESLSPNVMIAHADFTDRVDEAERSTGNAIKLKIVVGGEKEGWLSFEDLLNESTECKATQTKADDPFLYFFTSGTTGLPKIVVHSHFTYPVGHLSTLSWLGCKRGDIHYNISSPGWAKFAWSSFFAPWNAGATILANQVDSFVPKEQLATMEAEKVTTFCGSPTVVRMLIQEDISQYHLQLRSCCAAGEPLNPDVIDKWQKGTGVTIRDGFGQTETTALVANLPNKKLKPGSMGKATFLYDVGIYDEEGKEVPPLEEGIICVNLARAKNNGLFLEYLADKERTSNSYKHNLYYTGDKAYKDEDGYIWFIGRNDDVIKASAYRIGPFEVESVLIEHEDVVESAVVASPHPMRGYAVKAFVMLREGATPSPALAQELFSFSEERLAKYKVPRVIEFPESLPKTISGKIRRVELRANEATAKLNQEKREREYFHGKY